ncbi:MAG: AarF/ABC1/UbiB kinase family protein [Phycisphaerales bacterium]|nr:AarF/ABC1/UbiB kinase family protein [Phycisphaerales bacterium]
MTPLQFTRSVRSLNRMRHIARVLTRHGFGHAVTRLNLGRFLPVWMVKRPLVEAATETGAASIGRRLTLVCTELGPTFIKLGQMLSTRPDLLPAEVIEQLRALQDKVPPFDTPTAMQTIERELGRPVGECFEWIGETPFASASIGQVYRARLMDKRKEVVVKVRRPDIDGVIALDMQLLRWLAQSLESLMPEARIYRPATIVAEFEETITRELDYINEASTTARFGKAFADDEGLRIPKVYWEFTGPGVLTLEALPGRNLDSLLDADHRDFSEPRPSGSEEPPSFPGGDTGGSEPAHPHPFPLPKGERGATDAPRIDKRLVARRLADCYLKQAFEVGAFHADPHPGNILIEPPATVGLIDFGQVGVITDEWMTQLVVIVYACVNREVDVVIDALADMGAVGADTDRRSLHRAMQALLEKYYGLPLKRFELGTLLAEFSDIVRRHDVIVPRDLIMLIKAFSTVASVTMRLDPELNLLELLKPRLKKTLSDRFSPKALSREAVLSGWHLVNILREAPGQLRRGLRRLGTGGWRLDVRHENIDRLISELDRSSNRLAFSIVIAGIIIGSSVVVSARTDWSFFGISFQYLGIAGYLLAGVLGLGLSWAIFRSGRLH